MKQGSHIVFVGISALLFSFYMGFLFFPEQTGPNSILNGLIALGWTTCFLSFILGIVLLKSRHQQAVQQKFALFSHRYPRVSQLFLGIIIDFWIFFLAEGLFLAVNLHQEKQLVLAGENVKEMFIPDDSQGYKHKPGNPIHAVKRLAGTLVFDAKYLIDQLGRRMTPQSQDKERPLFAAFFGCSMTFGIGLNDDQTLPYFFSQQSPDVETFNYGVDGYGPQNMLAKIQEPDFLKEIKQSKGVFLYVFFDGHVARAIGSMHAYNAWVKNLPYFFLNESKELCRKGVFVSGRPFTSFLFRILGRIQILKYAQFDWPFSFGEEHFSFVSTFFAEADRKMKRLFPQSEFFVLFYPGSSYARNLIPFLQNAGVKYLDYSVLLDITEPGNMIEGDGHPTAKVQKELGSKLAQDLKKVFLSQRR